jgi:hypothetical protein
VSGVTLTVPELAGSYVAAEHRGDGTFLLRPDGPASADTERRARELAERHRDNWRPNGVADGCGLRLHVVV